MAHAASAELERPGRRLAELVALCERRLKDRFLSRSGRLYGWGIAVSYTLMMWLGFGDSSAMLRRALGTLAWLAGGMVVLSALQNPSAPAERGLLALVRKRGASESELANAQQLALGLRLLRVIGWPALVLAVAAGLTAREGAGPLAVLPNLLGVVVFGVVTIAVLTLSARAALILAPARVRVTFLALVLLPHLAHAIWPSVPSIPAVLGAVLTEMSHWSGA